MNGTTDAASGQAPAHDAEIGGHDSTASDVDEHGRPHPPLGAGEVETLLGFLEYQRATFAWKIAGVDADAMRVSVAASSMTLGGIAKHLAYVEDEWFSRRLRGGPRCEPWASVDWSADQDWEWNSAADDSPADLIGLWTQTVERSRAVVSEALLSAGLDRPCVHGWPDGRSPSLRWVLVHMIEEYARHNGHADLLREAIDGQTGE